MERLVIRPDAVFRDEWPGWAAFLGNGKERPRKPEDWVPVAEALAAQYGGVLPCGGWLRRNNYVGLYNAMRKRPDLFKHIPQDKPLKSPEEWVPVAEALAAEHGGILPCRKWIQKNNYSGLDRAMIIQPGLFEHIPQDKPYDHHKTPEEWVPIAEALAAKHRGVLPCSGWIQKNNYGGLDRVMRNRPELFEHIPQKRRDSHGCPIGNQGEAA